MADEDPKPTAIDIPPDQTLFDFANHKCAELLTKLNRLQIYIDDRNDLPREVMDLVRTRAYQAVDEFSVFVNDLKTFISQL